MNPAEEAALRAAKEAASAWCNVVSVEEMEPYMATLAGALAEADSVPERTPVNVLQAMWRAYNQAALEAEVAYFSLADDVQAHLAAEHRDEMVDAVDSVRGELSAMLAGNHTRFDWPQWIHADYEARLRGDKPMTAGPKETP